MVAGAVPPPNHPPEVAQGHDLGRHGSTHGGQHLYVLRLLATVHAAEISVGPQHFGRILPGRLNTGLFVIV